MMNYLPLLGFVLAMAWIVRQGYVSKKKYLQSLKDRDQDQHSTPR